MSVDYDVFAMMAHAVIDAANRGSLMMSTPTPRRRRSSTAPACRAPCRTANGHHRGRHALPRPVGGRRSTTTCTPRRSSQRTRARPTRRRTPSRCNCGSTSRPTSSCRSTSTARSTTSTAPRSSSTVRSARRRRAVEVPRPDSRQRPARRSSTSGRPAEKFTVDLQNGQTALVARRQGASGEYGPTEVRVTPMINATTVTLDEAPC